jgi:hypothetical protein
MHKIHLRSCLILLILLVCFSSVNVLANGTASSRSLNQKAAPCPILHCPPFDCPEPEPCPPCLFNDIEFYFGGLVGYSHTRKKINNHLTAGAPFNINSTLHTHKNSNDVIVEALLGGRYIFPNNITSGFELAGTAADPTTRLTLNHPGDLTFIFKATRKFCLIPSITFGKIFCCHWHAFVKMGMGISYANTGAFVRGFEAHRNRRKRQLGFVPAVGLEYAYSQNVSLLATAAYEYYKKLNVGFRDPLPGVVATDTGHLKFQFINVKVGFLYRI